MSYYARTYYTGNGLTRDYTIGFPYLDKSHVKVYLNGSITTGWTWLTSSSIRITVAPANGVVILIKRETSPGNRLVDYVSPSSLNETDLDTDSLQAFYLSQEAIDAGASTIALDVASGQFDAGNKRITNVADPVSNQDVATKNYVLNGVGSSVTAAANSAAAAAASASTASTKASEASASAGTAATKATDSAASATAAAASASTATTKASDASTFATQAAASATTATTKASDAAASATAAAGSASAANTSATNAATSATNAASSAAAAAASAATAAGLSTVQDQINAASPDVLADVDYLPARQNATGSLIKRTWANIKSDIRAYLGSAVSASGAKSTPVDADQLLLSDSASSNATAKLSWLNLLNTVWSRLGGLISGGTAKTTVAGGDMIPLADSASSNATAKVTFSNLWLNYLKPLADALYASVSHTHTFASLTSKPTTLSGFGITDAQPIDTELSAIAALANAAGVLTNNGSGGMSWASAAGGGCDLLLSTALTTNTTTLSGITSGKYKLLRVVFENVKIGANSTKITLGISANGSTFETATVSGASAGSGGASDSVSGVVDIFRTDVTGNKPASGVTDVEAGGGVNLNFSTGSVAAAGYYGSQTGPTVAVRLTTSSGSGGGSMHIYGIY